jgi:hypothetical protein
VRRGLIIWGSTRRICGILRSANKMIYIRVFFILNDYGTFFGLYIRIYLLLMWQCNYCSICRQTFRRFFARRLSVTVFYSTPCSFAIICACSKYSWQSFENWCSSYISHILARAGWFYLNFDLFRRILTFRLVTLNIWIFFVWIFAFLRQIT